MQQIKAVEAADMSNMLCTCKTQWYIMGMLIIITLGMLYLVTNKLRKTSFCKGHLFSNNTKNLLFISNTHSYVPIKLCRVVRSIHLFRIRGRLNPELVKIKKKLDLGCFGDRLVRHQYNTKWQWNRFTQFGNNILQRKIQSKKLLR